jgi:hypothetical protein
MADRRPAQGRVFVSSNLDFLVPQSDRAGGDRDLGANVHRLAKLHTNAKSDRELLQVWLNSHADASPHTVRVHQRVGGRFIAVLAAGGSDLRKATVEDVQAALEGMRTKTGGTPARPATVNTYVSAVKSFPRHQGTPSMGQR